MKDVHSYLLNLSSNVYAITFEYVFGTSELFQILNYNF